MTGPARKDGKRRSNTHEVGADIIVQLMWGPKTTAEMAEAVDCAYNAIEAWLKAFAAAGVVTFMPKQGNSIAARPGPKPGLWVMNIKPFTAPGVKITAEEMPPRGYTNMIAAGHQQ